MKLSEQGKSGTNKLRLFSDVKLEAPNGTIVYNLPKKLSQEIGDWTEVERGFKEYNGAIRVDGISDDIENKQLIEGTNFFTILKGPFGLNQIYRFAPECQAERFDGYYRGDGFELLIIDDEGKVVFNNIKQVERHKRKRLRDEELYNERWSIKSAIVDQVEKHGPERRSLDTFDDLNDWYGIICSTFNTHTSIWYVETFGKYQIVKLFSKYSNCGMVVFDLETNKCIWSSINTWFEKFKYMKEDMYYVIADDKCCMVLNKDGFVKIPNINRTSNGHKINYRSTANLFKPRSTVYTDCRPVEQLHNSIKNEGIAVGNKRVLSSQCFMTSDEKGKDKVIVAIVYEDTSDSSIDRGLKSEFIEIKSNNKSCYKNVALASFGYALLRKIDTKDRNKQEDNPYYTVDLLDTLKCKIIAKDLKIGKSRYLDILSNRWRDHLQKGYRDVVLKTEEIFDDCNKIYSEIVIHISDDSIEKITYQ